MADNFGPMWPHFVSLVGRAWHAMTAATSTNTLGFILWTLGLTAMGWVSSTAARIWELKCEKVDRPVLTALRGSLISGLFIAFGMAILVGIAWISFAVRITFYDHQERIAENNQLRRQNAEIRKKLDEERHTLNPRDPSFGHIQSIIQAFMTYRRDIGDTSPCRLLFSATPDAQHLVDSIMPLAVTGARCANGNLLNIGVKPENDEAEEVQGMQPGVVMLHALPDNKGANNLETNLGNLIQVRRSYKFPLPPGDGVVWLQFGPGAKWNSELFR